MVNLKKIRKAINGIVTDDSNKKHISSMKRLRLSVEEKLKKPLKKFLKANPEAKDLFRQTIREIRS